MRILLSVITCATLLVPALTARQYGSSAEQESMAYASSTPTDAVARLQKQIDAGTMTLQFDEARGYLPSVLRALNVPASSQGLVFSRTSLQVDRIAPWTPRALYFNDDVYVGWVQGGPMMEIASADPNLGGVFYTLDQQQTTHPIFQRQTHTCLQCHDSSSSTGGVPGFIMRSVVTDRYGYAIAVDTGATTDQTPLEKRWGGWYVTGSLGTLTHMGNAMSPLLAHEMGNVQAYLSRTKVTSTGGVSDLSARFDVDPYLSRHSDAVALLVLAHQTYVHNLLTIAKAEARKAARENPGGGLTPPVRSAAERLLRAMLFVKEASYPGSVKGTSAFADEFVRQGPRDRRGRSLRDLDLERRLFRYPLSYLIYSDAFDSLPSAVKTQVFSRLREVLGGQDASADFAHLSSSDREAILEILSETKPDFAASAP